MFVPVNLSLVCPRCLVTRTFLNLTGTQVKCTGCEYNCTLTTTAPTGTATALLAAGGTAITVASGGASFTSGMKILYDTGGVSEILVSGVGTSTSIPVSAALSPHSNGATFGQLAFALTNGAVVAAGYGNEQVQGFPPFTPTAAEMAAYPAAFD
jgi:hypothetical protein